MRARIDCRAFHSMRWIRKCLGRFFSTRLRSGERPHTSTHIARFGGSRDGACQSIKREAAVVTSASDSVMSADDSCERCECCGVRIYRCQHDAGERFPSCTEMLRAAEAGNIRRVRRLHENGCPWDEGTCARAAKHGHFDCLKYLIFV